MNNRPRQVAKWTAKYINHRFKKLDIQLNDIMEAIREIGQSAVKVSDKFYILSKCGKIDILHEEENR